MFKNMGANIPGGNFLSGNFPGGNFSRESLMGRNYPGGSFPDTTLVPDTILRKAQKEINFLFILCRFSFVSNVMNFFIYSLNKFALKMLLNWTEKKRFFLCRINSFQNQNIY